MESTRNICTIEDCAEFAKGQGMCNKHYLRVRKYGDPHFSRAYLDPKEAFKANTRFDGNCLIWTAHRTPDGYGRFNVGGGRRMLTHRFAWETEVGPIPEGLLLDHICRNPACCNVRHLRLVTNKQNCENVEGPRTDSASGFLGVHKHGNRWRVVVGHYGRRHNGGSYGTPEEANAVAVALRNRLFTHNDADRT